ncbi:MAG: TerC family protein [Dehalococcoidia bacterium]|nr:TerC family protein [Dehalococcoidia bacterium]
MSDSVLLFGGFGLFVAVMLILDLGVFHRNAHSVRVREAVIWYGVWVSLALLFNLGIYGWKGTDSGNEFLTAYVIELSLSVDNIFVFLIVFSSFAVPPEFRHRVLFMGIVGAVVMRGFFIATGVALLETFGWLIFIFGGFLVLTGIRLAIRKEGEVDPARNPVMRLARKFLPVTSEYDGQKFFTRRNGALVVTPLFMVLLGLETTDLIFAVDSVPAVLAISDDTFIIWTSNVFAILGLRALFFLVDGILPYFRYLNFGLSVILVFIGIKMITSDVYHMPTPVSLGTVGGVLAVTILASYVAKRREDAASVRAAERAPGRRT